MFLHWDARHGAAQLAALKSALQAGLPPEVSWQVLDDRLVVRWGEYSIVEATRRLMVAALADTAFGATHLLLASGSCLPVRPASSLQAFLAARPGVEFIQAHDIALGRWVDDGLEEERFRYYFPFNFATARPAFELATHAQRLLGVRRAVPEGLRVHFGSQWFCLTRGTAADVVDALNRPVLSRFFRRSWIPDEFAIQTLVAHLRLPSQIAGHGLTYYEFGLQGRPLVLEDGHEAHVLDQPFFFVRKVAPEATALRAALAERCAQPEADTGWFERAGTATVDYQRFLVRALQDPAARAHVGAFRPAAGGPMAASRRRYYVLHGASRGYVMSLTKAARGASGDAPPPILDFPFDRTGLGLAADRHVMYGLRPEDRHRARYDPAAFLRELAWLHPTWPTAFALDPASPGWVRDFVARDPRAVIVDCDPPAATRQQRAAAALRHVVARHDAWVLQPTLAALRDGTPLPQDLWRDAGARPAGGARFVRLVELGLAAADATADALARAATMVPSQPWYPAQVDAQMLIAGAVAPPKGAKN